MADKNNEGHVDILLKRLQSKDWREYWDALKIGVLSFAEVGLDPESSDRVVWETCQRLEVVLITNNRNAHSPDSLEVVLRTDNRLDSLPVITIADPHRLRHDSAYLNRAVERLMAYLLDIKNYRGAGRLYLP